MIKFLVDSGSDYTLEEAKEKGIYFAPLSITFSDGTFLDGVEIDRKEFYDRLINKEQFPKTAQPSPQTFLEFFEDAKENGDEVIAITISSGISGTYQSACIAKDMAEYDKIHVIDSKSAIYAIKIMVDYGIELRDQGKSFDEIVETLEKMVGKIHILLAVNTLDNLYKGGRLTKMEAGIGNLAKLKPVISVPDGKVTLLKKCIGKKKAVNNLIELSKEIDIDPKFPLYATYTFDTKNMEMMKEKFSENGINITEAYEMGATIGTHVGAGAFGVIIVEKF